MQAVLVIFRSDGARRSVPVGRHNVLIGRGEDCDLRIGVLEVSRHHCRLIRDAAGWKVRDEGSSNGTLVNGQRVSEMPLAAGDTIQIGTISIVVQINGRPLDGEIVPGLMRPVPAKSRPGGETGLEADVSADQPYDPMADFAMEEEKQADSDEDEKVDFDFGDAEASGEDPPKSS